MRYGGARPSCVLGLLWIGVADLVGVTRGWAAVAVEAAGGSVVGQVDDPHPARSCARRSASAPTDDWSWIPSKDDEPPGV